MPWALCLYIVVIAGVGLPVWWRTTTIYRASLPCELLVAPTGSESDQLPLAIQVVLDPALLLDAQKRPSAEFSVSDLERALHSQAHEHARTLSSKVAFRPVVSVITTQTNERIAHTIEEMARALNANSNAGDGHLSTQKIAEQIDPPYFFAANMTPGSGTVFVVADARLPRIVVGSSRLLIANLFPSAAATEPIETIVARVLFEQMADVGATSLSYDQPDDTLAKQAEQNSGDALRARRTFSTASSFEVLFTLALGAGSSSSASSSYWDPRAIYAALRPFLAAVSVDDAPTVSSQIIYEAQPLVTPTFDKKLNAFVLRPDQLQHFVNSQDWGLGFSTHNNPVVNLLVFEPPPELRPLLLLDATGHPAAQNGFLIPRWGGVLVVNPTADQAVELSEICSVLLAQLRLLMGLRTQRSRMTELDTVHVLLPRQLAGLTDFEHDSLLRSRWLEHLASARHSLKSFCQLLDTIPNMVVSDELQRKVDVARAAMGQANSAMQRNALHEAYSLSKRTAHIAEAVFFDSNALSLLYFPEDNKYAIYVPLFAPAGLPILVAVVKALRQWRAAAAAPSA
ncbi:hypothetical protein CAOG_00777 [Capsaspora owczarzaki ATCC 30864]|uniref:GPI transamidase component PIG-S n=1 Tax=Capsaspora owczarzaki (strain ATCC 30864) TaxID=595528 RepID=A0A0D2VH55_CAPO3|nr:hypothetical protein CAOG_00777 [Capsaspora owczarzaki ATCC 30864]KJE89267.1 hypothetical protein CAOG_000777 [Capsaspora owczarzaki ATCC 30864]|eukprot:XP_004365648.2 hypothetical protein CAOG_00777 [Capsaspora owczarzaki ATCC 30864]